MFNSHIHTNHSGDCNVPMETMCLAAIDAGFFGILITDHFSADRCISSNAYSNVIASVSEARALAEKYSSQLTVLSGVEVGEAYRKPDYTQRFLKALKPDCVLGSVHDVFIDNLPRNLSRMDFGKMSDDEAYSVIKVYFSELMQVVQETDYDILSHLTLPLRYTNGKCGKKLTLDAFAKDIEKILKAVIKKGKALELNTSDFDHQLFDFMPGKDILRKYYGMGGRLITIGTDAHKSENIAVGFNEAKALLKEIGFEHYYYYKNRKPVKVSL